MRICSSRKFTADQFQTKSYYYWLLVGDGRTQGKKKFLTLNPVPWGTKRHGRDYKRNMGKLSLLTPVKGNSFYERLTKNYDALQTLGEADTLRGFVMTMLKKLPQVKPDLVRVDDNWEEWSMKELIENLQRWLKTNKIDDSSTDTGESRKRERHWYTRG